MRSFYNSVWVFIQGANKGVIEKIHPPPTNSKNRLKSFCEVGYANFRPNVFAAGKRISMKVLVGVGLHAQCPVALKTCSFFKTQKCARKIFIVFRTLSDLNKISNRAATQTSYKMHENLCVVV